MEDTYQIVVNCTSEDFDRSAYATMLNDIESSIFYINWNGEVTDVNALEKQIDLYLRSFETYNGANVLVHLIWPENLNDFESMLSFDFVRMQSLSWFAYVEESIDFKDDSEFKTLFGFDKKRGEKNTSSGLLFYSLCEVINNPDTVFGPARNLKCPFRFNDIDGWKEGLAQYKSYLDNKLADVENEKVTKNVEIYLNSGESWESSDSKPQIIDIDITKVVMKLLKDRFAAFNSIDAQIQPNINANLENIPMLQNSKTEKYNKEVLGIKKGKSIKGQIQKEILDYESLLSKVRKNIPNSKGGLNTKYKNLFKNYMNEVEHEISYWPEINIKEKGYWLVFGLFIFSLTPLLWTSFQHAIQHLGVTILILVSSFSIAYFHLRNEIAKKLYVLTENFFREVNKIFETNDFISITDSFNKIQLYSSNIEILISEINKLKPDKELMKRLNRIRTLLNSQDLNIKTKPKQNFENVAENDNLSSLPFFKKLIS
jgi:hypothetical protein